MNMIVIETKLNLENGLSFESNVLAISKDAEGANDKNVFERSILPQAMGEIEDFLNQNNKFAVDMYSQFISRILNMIVVRAKEKGYMLRHIGQNEKYITTNQLEFVRAK